MLKGSKDAYDGTGRSIHIPTLIILEQDARTLHNLIMSKNQYENKVILSADIELSDESNQQEISYQLFYGSILDLQPEFIKSLYEYQHALGQRAMFIPRILTFECIICPEEIKDNYCLADGEFCFNAPSDEVLSEYPALREHSVLIENVRELCIYNQINDYRNDYDEHVFFNYIYNMRIECL